MAEFRDRINEALEIRDIKPADLARIAKVNEGAISQYRKGKYKASQPTLIRLANALNVSVPWLMGDDVPMSKANNAPCISPTENTVLITRRTGKKSRYTLEDKQTDLIEAMLEQMPKSEISYGEIAAEGGSLNRSKKKPETTL